jgi:hypothetical protein
VLPNIPIVEIHQDYMTDLGRLARACFPRVDGQCWDTAGLPIDLSFRLDTCAPFSILPFSVWDTNQLRWQLLGNDLLTLDGQSASGALRWMSARCVLAETSVCLYDEFNQTSRPLRVVAKLVQRPIPSPYETIPLLGYNFLTDNSLTVTLHPHQHMTAGRFADIVGYLTIP